MSTTVSLCYYSLTSSRAVTTIANPTHCQHYIMPRMDDIDLDIKIKELEESVKCRRERRKEQKKEMEQELEKSMKKESSRSQDRIHSSESEKKTAGSSLTVNLGKYNSSSPSNGGHLVSDQEEKYIKELCETEKRIRQLESTISDLNFELEKIDLAETTGVSVKSLEMEVGMGHGDVSSGRVSTDI